MLLYRPTTRNISTIPLLACLFVAVFTQIYSLFQRPYLTRMIPTFGPRAGGTKVVFVGGFLGRENSSVSVRTWVGDITFKVEYRYVTPYHRYYHLRQCHRNKACKSRARKRGRKSIFSMLTYRTSFCFWL